MIPLKALILEDEPADAELMIDQLRQQDFDVFPAFATEEASFYGALSQDLDVILADYALRGFTGLDALGIARQTFPDVPFIIVTGALGDEQAAECIKRGADDYLLKDRLARLGTAIRDAMRARALRAERAINERQIADLRELEAMKSRLLLTVAHELKSPVTAIRTTVDVLNSMDVSNNPLMTRAVSNLKRGTTRLERFVNLALDFALFEENRVVLDKRPIDIRELVVEAFELMLPAATAKEQTVSALTPDVPVIAFVDGDRLERVVLNFLSNAIKYTPDGGTITVEVVTDHGDVIIRVSDSGAGIPAAHQAHIFERIVPTVDQSDHLASTGLGLSIAKVLVELHGGTVGVGDRAGGGAEFWARLPAGV